MTPEKNGNSGSPNLGYLTLEQVRTLIANISNMRDKLMFRVLYETGCTINELVEIKASDIGGNTIKIKDHDNVRFTNISGKLAKDLSLFIKGNKLAKEDYILSTRQSQKMSEKRVRQLIQSYTEKAHYGKINPQMFRYYHVAHAYNNGIMLENISKQLGVTSFRIFQIISELRIKPKDNHYNRFLNKI